MFCFVFRYVYIYIHLYHIIFERVFVINIISKMIKSTFNKFHKKLNSDISLINWVLYRLQVLFWCPNNQNEFYKHANR
jgi:hypothetical protein